MSVRILQGDCREVLPGLQAESVQCCVTSPPYFGLRSYGIGAENGEIGSESSPDEFVAAMVAVFREVRRVLRADGVVFLNLGDSYAGSGTKTLGRNDAGRDIGGRGGNTEGSGNPGRQGAVRLDYGAKPKDLLMIPARVALALQADGWWLRSDIIWAKPNPLPESVNDRPTSAHEHVFLLTKNERYFWDAEAVAEPASQPVGEPKLTAQHKRSVLQNTDSSRLGTNQGAATRNIRNIWNIPTSPCGLAHFAMMPPALAERCILAGSRKGDMVLDPFAGAGTTLLVADRLARDAVGIELNPSDVELSRQRIHDDCPMFSGLESVA